MLEYFIVCNIYKHHEHLIVCKSSMWKYAGFVLKSVSMYLENVGSNEFKSTLRTFFQMNN